VAKVQPKLIAGVMPSGAKVMFWAQSVQCWQEGSPAGWLTVLHSRQHACAMGRLGKDLTAVY
jgi:hypothetical protein